jgi:YD repeat-containing protein
MNLSPFRFLLPALLGAVLVAAFAATQPPLPAAKTSVSANSFDRLKRVSRLAWLGDRPIVAKGDSALSDQEADELSELYAHAEAAYQRAPSEAAKEGVRIGLVNSLEGFLTNHVNSSYNPAIHSELADYYRPSGYFSRALDHWGKAWQECATYQEGNGRNLADRALVRRASLLASLGRLEELVPLLKAQKGRILSEPHLAQIWVRTTEAVYHMERQPGIAYKCGVYALNNVARKLIGRTFATIGEQSSTLSGFSLASLTELARQHELGLAAAFRTPGAAFVVPSLVHWKQNHYAAIVDQQEGRYLVQDPTFLTPVWVSADALEEEASGYFLVQAQVLPKGWRSVGPVEAGQVYGKGYPEHITDDGGPGCITCCEPGSGAAGTGSGEGCGMAAWKVQEPNINLEVWDIPLTYQPAYGAEFVLKLNWRQRNVESIQGSRSHFVDGWESDLLSFVYGYPAIYNGSGLGDATLPFKRGNSYISSLHFADAATVSDTDSYTGLWAVRTVAGGKITALDVYYRNGSVEHYDLQTVSGQSQYDLRLTSRKNATMKGLNFAYDDDSNSAGNGRLLSVTTADGAQFNFGYTDAGDAYRITGVTGPDSRSVSFTYSASSGTTVLSSITDAVGLVSSFQYDTTTWWLTHLTTPYGTTDFAHFVADGCATGSNLGCAGVDRSLVVTEPDGSHQAYLFYDNDPGDEFTGKIPATFASGQIPQYLANDPPVQTLDTIRNKGNSHYWNRQQTAALSTLTLGSLRACLRSHEC